MYQQSRRAAPRAEIRYDTGMRCECELDRYARACSRRGNVDGIHKVIQAAKQSAAARYRGAQERDASCQ